MIALTPVSAAMATDQSWNCRNVDLEISCGKGTCTIAEAHTPMDVHVSTDAISVCAYTGCWTGAPSAVVRSAGFTTFTGAALAFSSNPENLADISVTVDIAANVATILVAGLYATPATCTGE